MDTLVKVFVFGAPDQGFEVFPKTEENLKIGTSFDNRKSGESYFRYLYQILPLSSRAFAVYNGIIAGGRYGANFGVCVEFENGELPIEQHPRLEEYLKWALEDGLLTNDLFLDKSNKFSFRYNSLYESSTILKARILQIETEFEKQFGEQLIRIFSKPGKTFDLTKEEASPIIKKDPHPEPVMRTLVPTAQYLGRIEILETGNQEINQKLISLNKKYSRMKGILFGLILILFLFSILSLFIQKDILFNKGGLFSDVFTLSQPQPPSTERPSTERPSTERPSTERPSTERPPIKMYKALMYKKDSRGYEYYELNNEEFLNWLQIEGKDRVCEDPDYVVDVMLQFINNHDQGRVTTKKALEKNKNDFPKIEVACNNEDNISDFSLWNSVSWHIRAHKTK